jgi:hypothetical protein
MDIFSWSIPFVTEKGIMIHNLVTEMLYMILRHEE